MASRHECGQEHQPDSLRLVLKAELSELDRLTDEFARYGERHALPARDVQHCLLACDELFTNIVRYGYPSEGSGSLPGCDRQIVCELASDAQTITLTLIDDAIPYNPLDRSDPDVTLALEEREPGGLGVYFVKQVMNEASYERDGGCNKLKLIKRRSDGGGREHGYSI